MTNFNDFVFHQEPIDLGLTATNRVPERFERLNKVLFVFCHGWLTISKRYRMTVSFRKILFLIKLAY